MTLCNLFNEYSPFMTLLHKTIKALTSFTRYFSNYIPPRSVDELTAEIFGLEQETWGILNDLANN